MKAHIFDQDGTLYAKSHPLLLAKRELTKKWLCERTGVSTGAFDAFYTNLQARYPSPAEGFASLGLSIEEFNAVCEEIPVEQYVQADEKLRSLLVRLSPCFIVTLASTEYSVRVQRALHIDDIVTGTYSAIGVPAYSKLHWYMRICAQVRAAPHEVLVVGDTYKTDLAEAAQAGFNTVLVGKDVATIHDL